jgi:hypothetical protein
MNTPIYVVNFKDDLRKNRMIDRFKTVGYELKFVPPVTKDDPRLDIKNLEFEKRTWSIMLQHLDSVRDFYENTTDDHCIVCEDDIMISKNFNTELPIIIKDFNELELDILLLGYLFPHKIYELNHYFSLKNPNKINYTYHNYPDDLWGCQMYLISRKYAKYLLDTFTIEYAINNLNKPYYSPDWVITKNGNRAIIYPLIAVEEGDTKTDHVGQNDFHRQCFLRNYNPNVHI